MAATPVLPPSVVTVGHGTLPAAVFADLLAEAGVEHVVDVRSYPGSRRHPQFGRDAIQAWLPEAGIGYSWLPGLGGRRKPSAGSRHPALRNDQFRAYADHMESADFRAAVGALLEQASVRRSAVMCAESVWWRCHRRLLADHLVLVAGIEVGHLFHDGRVTAHQPADEARRVSDAVVYDVGVTPPLLDDEP